MLQVGHPTAPELERCILHVLLHILLDGDRDRGQDCYILKIMIATGNIQGVLVQTSIQRVPPVSDGTAWVLGIVLIIHTEPRRKETTFPPSRALRGQGRDEDELQPSQARVLAGRLSLGPEFCP